MTEVKLIDTHAHLDFPELCPRITDVLSDAKKNKVTDVVTISTHLDKINTIIDLSKQYSEIFFTVGVHPNNAHKDSNYKNGNMMIDISKNNKCVGIGEGGLDYFYSMEFVDYQKESFITQINVARDTKLPLIIHSRNADKDMIDILTSEFKNGSFKAILHCFSSGAELAKCGLDLNFFISFSGIVTFNSAKQIQEIAKDVPLDKILIETDSPYLSPSPYRGSINEPKNCFYTAKFLSELKNIEFEEFAENTYRNSLNIYQKIRQWKTNEN